MQEHPSPPPPFHPWLAGLFKNWWQAWPHPLLAVKLVCQPTHSQTRALSRESNHLNP